MFNLLERLNKIKTPTFLKSYLGSLLFKPESETAKQFFGINKKSSVETRTEKIRELTYKPISLGGFTYIPPKKLQSVVSSRKERLEKARRYDIETSAIARGADVSILKELKPSAEKVVKGIGSFLKDVQEGMARSGASVGLTSIAFGVEKFAPLVGLTKEEAKKEADEIRNFGSVDNPVAKVIFGEKPIKAIETRIAEAEVKVKKFGKEIGIKPIEKGALPLAVFGVGAVIGLDFTGWGGGKKQAVKYLAKVNKIDDVVRVLKQINVADDLIPTYSKIIAKMNKVDDVARALDKIIDIQKTTKPAQKVINALKEAKPLRKGQEALYTKARGAKLAKLIAVGKKVTGEKGFYAEKGALKGKLPKVQFESIRKKIGQKDIDNLFNQVKESPLISIWDKITAREGLVKIFGKAGGQVPTKGELSLLKDVFGGDFTKAVLDKRTLLQKMTEAGYQLANIPRSIMASFDLSAPLRQGIFLIGRPKRFFSAFAKQFKTFVSEKAYKALQDEIISRPTYSLMRKNKLAITELGTSLTTREEAFMSGWAERIPLVGKVIRASSRAYTGFLNKLRADVFDDFIKQGTKLGIKDPKFLKDAASFVNHATGRGSLGGLERAAVPLNTFFFSPRLTMSRLNLINPVYYVRLQPRVRWEALKSLFTFAGTAATVAGLMKMGGAEIETDPRNADFMKPKFGNKRYDILGGFQQPIRLAAQLISGKIISSTTGKTITLGEGYKPLTRADIIQRYFEYKESPLVSFAHALLKGQTAIGEKVDIPTEVANRFIPMVVQDMYDLYREEGIEGIPMAFPAIFGVGVQSYGGVESYNLAGRKYKALNQELSRLKVSMGFPTTQAFGQELSNKEYKKLRKISGEMIADALTEIIASEDYKKLSDYEKKQLINKVVDKTKDAVKDKMFVDKKLQNEIKKRLMKKGIDEEKAEEIAKDIYLKEFGGK